MKKRKGGACRHIRADHRQESQVVISKGSAENTASAGMDSVVESHRVEASKLLIKKSYHVDLEGAAGSAVARRAVLGADAQNSLDRVQWRGPVGSSLAWPALGRGYRGLCFPDWRVHRLLAGIPCASPRIR